MLTENMIRIVLQARTSSSRLPAKVLLPLANHIPVFSMASQRATSTGHPVVLATSTDHSDDLLARRAQNEGIDIVRGPLDDVLSRYIMAIKDMNDADICVRLTCDNVFPDGLLVDSLLEEFLSGDYDHMSASPYMPYGFSCEIIRVGALRKAHQNTSDDYEREHVTPWVYKNLKTACSAFQMNAANYSHYRCTIDTLEDYLQVAEFFNETPELAEMNSFELIKRYIAFCDERPGQPIQDNGT